MSTTQQITNVSYVELCINNDLLSFLSHHQTLLC